MSNLIHENRNVQDNVNKHGLRISKVNHRLRQMMRDIKEYRPKEIARDLVKLAHSIEPQITITTAQKLELDNPKCT